MMQRGRLEQERQRSHRSTEGVINDSGDEEEEGTEEGDELGHSQELQGSDGSDGELVDVVTGDENDEEDGTKDEVWLSEKRHSGDGEVTATFLSMWILFFNKHVIDEIA